MGAVLKEKDTKKAHLKVTPDELHQAKHDDGGHDDLMGGGHKKAEEGEGPWLVSYADMMTLLMGFFALIASFSKPDAKEFDKVAAASSQYFGGKYEAPYEQLGKSLITVLKNNKLDDQVKVEVSPEGVTMTFTGTLFFDSGHYDVRPEAVDLLNKLTKTIQQEATHFNAMIEGHTDNTPISQGVIASNWELSAVRAARIAQFFEKNGFAKDQLTIMGWGETKPVAKNENGDGSANIENRSKNRRVVIRVYKDLPK